jgi:CHAT domain-containing protein
MGPEIRGEGFVGLSRGFLYAGARAVIASLWSVDDLATARFMERFYSGLWRDKLSPDAALASAQHWIAHQPGWESPYYWAAFTLTGEWR